MRYEWDEAKRQINLRQHGIDFADIPQVLEGDLILLEDDRYDYGETRYIVFGLLFERVVVVAYTERGEDMIRLISARKASKHETRQFFDQITN